MVKPLKTAILKPEYVRESPSELGKVGIWEPTWRFRFEGLREAQALGFFTHSPAVCDASGARRDTWLRSECLT